MTQVRSPAIQAKADRVAAAKAARIEAKASK
jgi:hypothetical protein